MTKNLLIFRVPPTQYSLPEVKALRRVHLFHSHPRTEQQSTDCSQVTATVMINKASEVSI